MSFETVLTIDLAVLSPVSQTIVCDTENKTYFHDFSVRI